MGLRADLAVLKGSRSLNVPVIWADPSWRLVNIYRLWKGLSTWRH